MVGSIYARGHLTGDTVNGDAIVTFTSDAKSTYDCSVYGYSVEAASPANTGSSYLVFEGYAGSLTQSIGGFDSINFSGDAQVVFTEGRNAGTPTYGPIDPAAIQNGVWDFDFTDRDAAYASDAMLTWSGDMGADEVRLHFGSDATMVNSWTIATGLSDVAGAYDLRIDGGIGITAYLDTAITGTGTAYDGEWKLTFESNTLKFAKITA